MTDEDVRDSVALLVVEPVLEVHAAAEAEVGGGRGALGAAAGGGGVPGVVCGDLVAAAAAPVKPNAQATFTVVGSSMITHAFNHG